MVTSHSIWFCNRWCLVLSVCLFIYLATLLVLDSISALHRCTCSFSVSLEFRVAAQVCFWHAFSSVAESFFSVSLNLRFETSQVHPWRLRLDRFMEAAGSVHGRWLHDVVLVFGMVIASSSPHRCNTCINMFDEVVLSFSRLSLFACCSWAMVWSGSDTTCYYVLPWQLTPWFMSTCSGH